MKDSLEILKVFLRPTVYAWRALRRNILALVYRSKIADATDIPIIINNRNRLEYLLELINALETRGYFNIFIIDNNSDYPPLLTYYDKCKYQVFRLKDNVGHLALWETDIYKTFIHDYYVYTDSDVVPVEECPDDFMNFFWETLKTRRNVQKVGFSLKIDDLPDSFHNKSKVIEWESQFYQRSIGDKYFEGFIDTTFALYRPWMRAGLGALMYRTAYPYQARHKPWYVDSENLSNEEIYYISNAKTSTHWTKLNQK